MSAIQDTEQGDVEALTSVAVFDRSGDTVSLADCWSEQPAVLVFVRHFG